MDRLALIFDKPAEAWNEALPLGNGTMGAMSYGRFQNERIELNLDSLWSGNGRNKENPNKNVDWDLFRKHIFAGDYQGAENYCKENVLGDWTESYLPAGTLSINVKEPIQNGNSFYRRELCLTNATEKIEFCQDDLIYQREFFVSMSEPVMAIHYHTSPNCNLEMSITLESEIKHKSAFFAEKGRHPFMLHHLIIPAKFLSFMKRGRESVLQLDYMYKRTVEMYISKRISFL